MLRRLGYAAAAVAGVVVVTLDWHPRSVNPAVPINRVSTIGVVVLLMVLPWLTARWFGPVADSRAARTVRAGGYLAVYALLLVLAWLSNFASSRFDDMHAFDQANWEADMRSGAVVGAVLFVGLIGGYALAVLALTSRRAWQRTAAAPSAVTIGAGLGTGAAVLLYVLMPLGNVLRLHPPVLAAGYVLVVLVVPLVALLAAGVRTAHRMRDGDAGARLGGGALAGACAGGAAALVLATLTIATMLLMPGRVDLKWANPDPDVAHGTPFELRMSVGDAAIKYQAGLLLGPLVGLLLGAVGAATTGGVSEEADPASRSQPTPTAS